MSWNRLDSTEGSLSILLLTCIPCSGLLQFQHSISNTQKTYADSRHKLPPPCWEIKTHARTRTHTHAHTHDLLKWEKRRSTRISHLISWGRTMGRWRSTFTFHHQSHELFQFLQACINFVVKRKIKPFTKQASNYLFNLDSQGFLIPGTIELE